MLAILGSAFFGLMSAVERLVSWRRDLDDTTVQA
jgi:hypothetical protein